MVRTRVTHLLAALAASSCAAFAVTAAPDANDQPSASDVQMAMDDAFAETLRDRTDLLWGDCMAVTELQCAPARQGRSTCTYAYGHGRATAILDRKADGSWRWISGPYHCSIGAMSK
jgi:hypothetical protein